MSESVLKITKLQGSSNWELWAIRMEAVLTEKGYYDVMTLTPPTGMEVDGGKDAQLDWTTRSKKAIAYIRLALADGPLLQTRNITDPCRLWQKLQALYEPKGFSSDFLICKELFETTLSKMDNSIENYLNQIKRLTDDLSARNLTIPNKVIAAWTLNNLTSEYENTVAMSSQSIRAKQAAAKSTPATPKSGQFSTSDETDIHLDDLFAQLIDESRRLRSIHAETALNTKAGSGGAKPKRNKPKKAKKICGHCKRSGHTEDECWELHPELNPKNKRVSGAIPEEVSLISTETALHSVSDATEWILDSGATSHICSNKALFTHIEPHDIALKWGTASQIRTSGIGTLKIQFQSTNQM